MPYTLDLRLYTLGPLVPYPRPKSLFPRLTWGRVVKGNEKSVRNPQSVDIRRRRRVVSGVFHRPDAEAGDRAARPDEPEDGADDETVKNRETGFVEERQPVFVPSKGERLLSQEFETSLALGQAFRVMIYVLQRSM